MLPIQTKRTSLTKRDNQQSWESPPDNSGDNGRNEFLVKEARDLSTAGVMSHWVNYGSTRSNNNIDGWQKDRFGAAKVREEP